MEMDTNLLADINKKMAQLQEKVEKDVASKKDYLEVIDLIKAQQKELEKNRSFNKKNRLFDNEANAIEFVEYLAHLVDTHPSAKLKGNDPFNMHMDQTLPKYKTAANATTDAQGKYSVPTSVSDVASQLITEFGICRKLAQVEFFTGNQTIVTVTDDVTAAYSTDDTTNGTDGLPTYGTATITPKQIIGVMRASGKVLYNSALDIANLIMGALVRAVARLEDQTFLYGDGSATYGSQTGIQCNTSVPDTSVASLAAVTIDNLIDLKYNASEVSDAEGEYYVNRALVPVLRKIKASTAGTYQIGFQDGSFDIGGVKVNVIKQMKNGNTAGDMVAFYGDVKRGVKIGVQRDFRLDLSEHVDFVKAGLVFRAVEDFGLAIHQPTVLAKIRVASST